jgi:hypothetical protein
MDAATTRRFVKDVNVKANPRVEADESVIDGLSFFNSLKKGAAYALLFLLPLLYFPTPWAAVGFNRGILVLSFVTLFVVLDLIKVFSGSRVQIARNRLDFTVIALGLGGLLATLFSTDLTTSLWGFDKGLGSGLVVLLALIYMGFSLRDLIKTSEDAAKLIRSLVWGLAASAFLSLMAVIGTDVLGKLMGIDLLIADSISVLGTPITALVAWGSGLVLLLTLVAMGYDRKYFFANLIAVNFLVIAFVIFSVGQSLGVIVLTLIALLVVGVAVFMRRGVESRSVARWLVVIFAVVIAGVSIVRIPSVNDVMIDKMPVARQVDLNGETTWTISMASIAGSVKSGFFGTGLDTFPIIYNAYRPMYMDDLDLSSTTYSSGSNEFMTIIGTRGLVGGLLWIAVGAFVMYFAYDSFKRYLVADTDLAHLVLSVFTAFLYGISFVAAFNVVILFLFVFGIMATISLEEANSPREARFLVMQFDMLTEKISRNKKQGINWGVVGVTTFLAIFVYWGIGNMFMSSILSVSAENKLVKAQSEVLNGTEYTAAEERAIVEESVDLYSRAIEADSSNSYLYRRSATLIMQYVESDINEALQSEDPQAAFDTLSDKIQANTETALELTETAKEKASLYYSNWDTRASVLTKLVSYGYTNYLDDAYEALDIGLRLNPNNPGILYSSALLYQGEEKYAEALALVQEGLRLRVDLEPILLAAQLNIELDQYETGLEYLQAATSALTESGLGDSEIYAAIDDRLTEVKTAIASGNTQSLKNSSSIDVPEGTETEVEGLDVEGFDVELEN